MALVTLPSQQLGKVWLVGAGPGDVDLLTVKALRLLQSADVVLFDALVSDEIIRLIPAHIETISVGKRQGKHSAAQDEINQLLLAKAFSGQNIVRLKGGDPFIFGRGGEELQVLARAGIKFEVVPGITAASGSSAYSGIPLTHRDHTQGVSFITGHCQPNGQPLNWHEYANSSNTLVIYMGISQAQTIADALIGAGKDASTPVAIISKATTSAQAVVSGQLQQLHRLATDQTIVTPALIIVGEVVALADELNWFQPHSVNQANSFQQSNSAI